MVLTYTFTKTNWILTLIIMLIISLFGFIYISVILPSKQYNKDFWNVLWILFIHSENIYFNINIRICLLYFFPLPFHLRMPKILVHGRFMRWTTFFIFQIWYIQEFKQLNVTAERKQTLLLSFDLNL